MQSKHDDIHTSPPFPASFLMPQKDAMTSSPVHLPAAITGSNDAFISPSSVNQIVVGYEKILLLMSGGERMTLTPEPEQRKIAGAQVIGELFAGLDPGKKALCKLMGRQLNTDNVTAVSFRGGVLIATMRDGSTFGSRATTFAAYQEVTRILHGDAAAAALKPAPPSVATYEPRKQPPLKPKVQPRQSYAEWYDGLSAVPDAPAVVTYEAPSIPEGAGCVPAILAAVDRMENATTEFSARVAYMSGGDSFADGIAVTDSRIRSLRTAALHLQAHETATALAQTIRAAERVAESTARLPNDARSADDVQKLRAECGAITAIPLEIAA